MRTVILSAVVMVLVDALAGCAANPFVTGVSAVPQDCVYTEMSRNCPV
jgi:hypothetical protein